MLLILFCALHTAVVSAQDGAGDAYYRFDLSRSEPLYITTWLYQTDTGDTAASPKDSSHTLIDAATFIGESGVHWFSCRIVLSGTPQSADILFLRITDLFTAYEVFWDGICIASNGKPAASADRELPGAINFEARIPHHLAGAGEHTLTLRVSNYQGKMLFPKLGSFITAFGYYISWNEAFNRIYYNHHYFLFGACIIAMILSISLFFSGRRNKPFLLFGIYCFFLSLIPVMSFIFQYYDISIIHINLIDIISIATYSLKDIFFIAFIVTTFTVPRKWLYIISISGVLLLLNVSHLSMSMIMTIKYYIVNGTALLLLCYAALKKKRGSIAALAGLLSYILIQIFLQSYPEIYPFGIQLPVQPQDVGFILFITGILFSISAHIREQNQLNESLLIRSKYLEIELLKRHIKPHFLMNTLFTVISLIRKNPGKAITMIEYLADEFQLINKISQRTLIPLSEELDLCRKHLDIMQLRKNGAYDLITEHIEPDRLIPPMIFHTLIENAITHAYTAGEPGRIVLTFLETDTCVRYTMKNDGSRLIQKGGSEPVHRREGTGFKYVKSRLEESYPGRWSLDHGIADGNWIVKITVGKEEG